MEVVASLSQGRTAAAHCGLFTHKSVPVIFEPPCSCLLRKSNLACQNPQRTVVLIRFSRLLLQILMFLILKREDWQSGSIA